MSPKSPTAGNVKSPGIGGLGDTKLTTSALDKLNMPIPDSKVLNDDKDSLMISSGFENRNLDSSLELSGMQTHSINMFHENADPELSQI